MIRKKRIKSKNKKNKNPFLNPDGGFDLIEIFPSYKNKKKRKTKR
jgi:hypothetical protein